MKKKQFLLLLSLLLSTFLTSCSKYADNINKPLLTKLEEKVALLDSANNVEYSSNTFECNEDFSFKIIELVKVSNTVVRKYNFDYEPNNTKTNTVSAISGMQTITELNHQAGILASTSNQGNTTTFTYNEQTDTYSWIINIFENTFSFDQYNNLSHYLGTKYVYDYSRKGILFNVPNLNKIIHFFSNYLQGDSNLKCIFTSKPLTEVNLEDFTAETISFTNECNSGGFLVKTFASNT